jgi:chromosome segregation ATPase
VLSPLIVPSPTILSQHPADDLHPPDSPTTSLISALRASLQQLTEQSHQLNTKLVTSISRVADLEGTLDDLRDEQEQRAKTVEELERDKAQWEESMKTGLLVERDQIRDEMQRLAAGLVEEERRRGSAELGREKLEGEVDVLTATLFDQVS